MKDRFVGENIGKVFVVSQSGIKDGRKQYECICSCGSHVLLDSCQLIRNKTPACYKCGKRQKFKDLTGQRFERLTVVKKHESGDSEGGKSAKWLCKCDCGNEVIVAATALPSGHTRSCGCLHIDKISVRTVDLLGQVFGKLTVVAPTKINAMWECMCECGKTTKVRSTSLRDGTSTSCGCNRIEKLSGPNSRFWKGGITVFIRGLRASSANWKWVRYVKKRDNYTCQACLATMASKDLHAHHIKNFSSNICLAFDPENGITFCSICHYAFHAKYGKTNNDREQVEQFIKSKGK